MMSATSEISLPLEIVKTLLGRSSTWQGLCQLNEPWATGRVHIGGVAAEDIERPFATIWPGEFEKHSHGVGDIQGTIGIVFEMLVPEAYAATDESAIVWFLNAVGAILDEMYTAAQALGWIWYGQYRTVMGPTRADRVERKNDGDFMQYGVEIVFGVKG